MATRTRVNPLAKTSSYIFLLGVIIAIIAGLAVAATTVDKNTQMGVGAVLTVFGVVVGLMSASGIGTINKQDITNFLTASIALVVSGAGAAYFATYLPTLGEYIAPVLGNIALFVVPIAVIVALKSVWDIGSAI
jgi:uncharacterized membrane protein YhhN